MKERERASKQRTGNKNQISLLLLIVLLLQINKGYLGRHLLMEICLFLRWDRIVLFLSSFHISRNPQMCEFWKKAAAQFPLKKPKEAIFPVFSALGKEGELVDELAQANWMLPPRTFSRMWPKDEVSDNEIRSVVEAVALSSSGVLDRLLLLGSFPWSMPFSFTSPIPQSSHWFSALVDSLEC